MEEQWMSQKSFCDYCKEHPFPPLLRLFLLSDGTVTHFLEAFFLKTMIFELEEQSSIVLTDQDAQRLSLPKGEKAMQRKGWLTLQDSSKKVLYVDSILPTSRFTPRFYQEILLGQKALGQIIHDQKLLFRRDLIEIGCFSLPKIAREFGLPSDWRIWARRYHLTLSGEGSVTLFEAISPEMADLMMGSNGNESCLL